MTQKQITIRSLHTLADMQPCVELQREVWGFTDLELVPDAIFAIAAKTGGQVLAALKGDSDGHGGGGQPVGFALAFPAFRGEKRYLHSHMVAVLPGYQNQSIGRELKLAQRKEALERGIDLIEWTFDPFQLKNAHFNLVRLGAIARLYLPDAYGRTTSPLHGGLPTDRLVVEWWLRSPRVLSRLEGKPEKKVDVCERISLPAGILELCRTEPQKAQQIQRELRTGFEKSFARGYTVAGFEMNNEQGTYLMAAI